MDNKKRKGGLESPSFKTLEEYCRERWGIEKSQTYRLMESAKIVGILKTSPIGELPKAESIVRPPTSLPPKKQKEAFQKAVETAPEG